MHFQLTFWFHSRLAVSQQNSLTNISSQQCHDVLYRLFCFRESIFLVSFAMMLIRIKIKKN